MKQPLTPPSIATLALAGLLGALLLVPVRPVEASPKPARAPAPASVPATSGDLSVELREVQKQLNAARATLAKTPARTAKARAERKKVETQLRSAQQRLDSARAILRRTVAPRAVRPASPTRVRSVIDTRPLSASDARFLAEASALAASSLAEVASTGLDGSHGMGSAALGMDGSHNIVTTEVALDGAHQLRPSVPILRDVPLVDVRNRAMPPAVPAQESRLLQLDPTVEKELARMMQEVRGLKLDPAAQKALEQAMQEVRRHKVAAQAQEQMAKALAELRMREARYGGVRPAAAGQGTGRFTSPGIALPPGKTGAFGSRFEGGSPGGPVEGEFLAPVPPRAEWFREVRAPGVLRVQSGSAVRTRIDRTVEIANDRIVVVVGGKRHLITIPKGQDRVVAHGVVITRKKMADGKSAYQIEIRR